MASLQTGSPKILTYFSMVSNTTVFRHVVIDFLSNLSTTKVLGGQLSGHSYGNEPLYNVQSYPGVDFLIWRVFNINNGNIDNMLSIDKVSFVCHPVALMVHVITDLFDINICKCQWFFKTNTWILLQNINTYICTKTAVVVKTFTFSVPGFIPTDDEITSIVQMWCRMQKYQQQGFQFLNGPKILPCPQPFTK
jgi:hypothetical protein